MQKLTFFSIVIVISNCIFSLIIGIAGLDCTPSILQRCPTKSDCDKYCKADNCDKYWSSNPYHNEEWRNCVNAEVYCDCPSNFPVAAIIGIIGTVIVVIFFISCFCKSRNSSKIVNTTTTTQYSTPQRPSGVPFYAGYQNTYLQQTNPNFRNDFRSRQMSYPSAPPAFLGDNDLPSYEQATDTNYNRS